jgi:hypothetical protein
MPAKHTLAWALAFALLPTLSMSATPDQAVDQLPAVAAHEQWTMHGGSVLLRFNVDRLSAQGVLVVPGAGMKAENPDFKAEIEFPLLHGGGLRFAAPNGNFQQFTGGKVMGRDGFKMRTLSGMEFDFSRFELRADPHNPLHLQLVGTDGEPWFYVNHVMYKLVDDYQGYYIRSADINATAAFAARVGAPSLAGAYIGELKMLSEIAQRPSSFAPADAKAVAGGPNFHGTDGYKADVLLTSYTMQFARCRMSGGSNGCDGNGGDNGEVVFVPSSTLRNTNNADTADVPWYDKFTVSPYNYPYPGNDQHPYLIWNLYRVIDGQLEQIGASGVKHAFLTTNGGCTNPFGNHILSPNCSDTYGTGNNDNTGDLGPRRELIPATGRWGRCFSIFDTNCDGSENGVGSNQYQNRMISRESQLEPVGATFYTDSWYVIQDDINIYNTMGHRVTTLAYVPPNPPTVPLGSWSIASQGTFTVGPVIDTWVNPITHPTENVDIRTGEGNAKIAVKVKTLANCPAASGLSGTCYRYDYAVHNFDVARAVLNTSPPANAGANLQVLGNTGFVSVSLPFGGDTPLFLDSGHFADIDTNAANDWSGSVGATAATWTAPAENPLNWGTLYRYSVVTNVAPNPAHTKTVVFGMQGGDGPASYSADIMVPNTFDLFSDGMED